MSGEWFALLAAASNGSIGLFNRFAFAEGANYLQLGFWKCFGAFCVLTLWALVHPSTKSEIIKSRARWRALSLLSFLGIFTLYYFETWAFQMTVIPVVSFLTYASGIIAVLGGILFLGERLTSTKVFSFVLVLMGVFIMFTGLDRIEVDMKGAILAVIGGAGYSTFLLGWRYLKVPSKLSSLWWLFGFGSIYLFIPLALNGDILPPLGSLPYIGALILLPTIGGYFFTSKALNKSEAGRVQIIESSDPLFASALGFVFLGDLLSPIGWIGAGFIFFGLLVLVKK